MFLDFREAVFGADFGLIAYVPEDDAVFPGGEQFPDHGAVLVLLEGDDDVGGEEVLLADLSAGGGGVAEIDLAEGEVLLGLRGEDELRREEMDGEAAGEGLPGKVEELGLMIEDRFGEAATVVIARADE